MLAYQIEEIVNDMLHNLNRNIFYHAVASSMLLDLKYDFDNDSDFKKILEELKGFNSYSSEFIKIEMKLKAYREKIEHDVEEYQRKNNEDI